MAPSPSPTEVPRTGSRQHLPPRTPVPSAAGADDMGSALQSSADAEAWLHMGIIRSFDSLSVDGAVARPPEATGHGVSLSSQSSFPGVDISLGSALEGIDHFSDSFGMDLGLTSSGSHVTLPASGGLPNSAMLPHGHVIPDISAQVPLALPAMVLPPVPMTTTPVSIPPQPPH